MRAGALLGPKRAARLLQQLVSWLQKAQFVLLPSEALAVSASPHAAVSASLADAVRGRSQAREPTAEAAGGIRCLRSLFSTLLMLLSRAQEEAHECRPLLASAAYDMSGLLTRAITAPQLFNVASPLLCALLAHAPPDDTSCWELFSSQRVLVTLLSGARLESPAAVLGVLRLASFMVSRPVAGELLVRDYVLPALCTVPHLRKPPAVGTAGRALWHSVWCSVVSLASAMMRHLHGISAFAAQITEFVTVFQDRILACLTIDGARALDLSLPRVEEAERCTDLLCQLERHGAIWRFRQPAFAQVREGALQQLLLRYRPATECACAELPAAAAAARPLLLEPAVL